MSCLARRVQQPPGDEDCNADARGSSQRARPSRRLTSASEAVIHTGKVSLLARVSREQMVHQGASKIVTDSMSRSFLHKANMALLSQVAPTLRCHAASGLLNQSATVGGAVANDLDALALAVIGIEAANGRADVIIASPSAWASLTTFKTGSGSNAALVGAGVESSARQLLGVPVLVTSARTADAILVLDRSAVLSAAGLIELAVSKDAFFTSDSVGIRAGWPGIHGEYSLRARRAPRDSRKVTACSTDGPDESVTRLYMTPPGMPRPSLRPQEVHCLK